MRAFSKFVIAAALFAAANAAVYAAEPSPKERTVISYRGKQYRSHTEFHASPDFIIYFLAEASAEEIQAETAAARAECRNCRAPFAEQQSASPADLSASARKLQSEILNSKKPVLVDFYATWCGPCKEASAILDELSKQAKGACRIVKVDVDKEEELVKVYELRTVPTILIVKNGKIVKTWLGLPSDKDEFKKELREAVLQ